MSKATTVISLAGVRNEMKMINEDIQRKCDPSYEIKISQYRHRDKSAVVYDETDSNEYQILLCLYHKRRCVSSITGKYNKPTKSMILSSKTDAEYEGKKYNLYLRTIFIYLMCFVRPIIEKINSNATNPISIYTMYKHYSAFNPDLQEYVDKHKLTPEKFTLPDAINFYEEYKQKNKQTPESAKIILDQMVEDFEDISDQDFTIEDLGLGSEEEAIDYVIRTMSVSTVVLELSLETARIKETLMKKFIEMPILCVEPKLTKVSMGGKARRSKNKRSKNKRSKTRRTLKKN
jgi:hypothetical protein